MVWRMEKNKNDMSGKKRIYSEDEDTLVRRYLVDEYFGRNVTRGYLWSNRKFYPLTIDVHLWMISRAEANHYSMSLYETLDDDIQNEWSSLS